MLRASSTCKGKVIYSSKERLSLTLNFLVDFCKSCFLGIRMQKCEPQHFYSYSD